MTYDDGEEVVPELTLVMGDGKGNYVKLKDCEANTEEPSSSSGNGWTVWWWVKVFLLLVCAVVVAGVFLKWIGPYLMDKEVIPILHWETTTLSTPVLVIVIFASVALFPTLLLPSSPSMWMAGMSFGYGLGFLLIISAVAVGVSLPFFIGSLFHHKMQGWLEKYPKKASLIRLAGEGNWFNQFRAVTLIRISPFPYILFNYCAVATNVKYGPYLLGSLVGMVPDVFVAIYTGILIHTLADASHDKRSLSASQVIFNLLGFFATVATTIIVTVYAKKQLKVLKEEEELLLG